MLSNSADYLNDGIYYKVNEDTWTLSDLFIRQYLNNLVDGFGMVNVMEVYQYLCKHKDLLIEYNMVSKDGWNNSGLTLWENYNFDDYLERFGLKSLGLNQNYLHGLQKQRRNLHKRNEMNMMKTE